MQIGLCEKLSMRKDENSSPKEQGVGCCEILDVLYTSNVNKSRMPSHLLEDSIRRTSTSIHLLFMLSLLYLPRAIIGLYGNREPRMHGQDEGQCMRRFSAGRMKREREGIGESFMMVLSVFGSSKNDKCDRMVTG